ncbi:MAG: hypothetical protein NTW66_00475 [Candidatus Magasanikbacteria bacterium]|nr:hypothetical protein [Candidatus Magasanikbacteria bacterium]
MPEPTPQATKPEKFYNRKISQKTITKVSIWVIILSTSLAIAFYLLTIGQIKFSIWTYIKGDINAAKRIVETQAKNIATRFYTAQSTTSTSETKTITETPKRIINLEQVNNVGYQFYIGEIETEGQTNLSEGLKNETTQVLYKGSFPKSLLNDLAIIIVNTLAVTPNPYMHTPAGDIKVGNFSPDFMEGGGIYTQNVQDFSLIYINKTKITYSTQEAQVAAAFGNKGGAINISALREVLAHELGHHLGYTLTDSDWKQYYQLRKIPTATPRINSSWEQSPTEDFAEVYTNIYFGTTVKTVYGSLPETPKNEYDATMQRLFNAHTRKIVDEPTKQFVISIINRINSNQQAQAPTGNVQINTAEEFERKMEERAKMNLDQTVSF